MRFTYTRATAGIAAGAIALGLSIAPATQTMAQSSWTGSSTKEDLLYRLDVLDAEIADIRARLGGVAGGGGGRSVGGGDLGAVEGELRRLTAALERLQNKVQQIESNTARKLADIEFRLNELEGVPNDGTPQISLSDPTTPGASAEARPSPEVSVGERGDLDRAIRDVQQGRFDQAENRLRRFMNDYPGSPLTSEAWYWLGESQAVRGNHADAARSFLGGYKADQRGPQAPHNLYRLGVSLGKLGQIDPACRTLREVRSQFPNAPDGIVSKADAEADNLSCG